MDKLMNLIILGLFLPCLLAEKDLNCRFKPGCDVNQCDPLPWNQVGVEDQLQRKEFPITCKDKDSGGLLERMEDVEQVVETLLTKISELTGEVNELKERCKVCQDGAKQVQPVKNFPDGLCHVIYEQKCYWMVYVGAGINQDQAKLECHKKEKGKLANIYDKTHYDMITESVRTRIPNFLKFHTLWLGMGYDPQSNVTTLSDGKRSDFQQWYPGTPQGIPTSKLMIIWIERNADSPNQGMRNYFPNSIHHGALCQLE